MRDQSMPVWLWPPQTACTWWEGSPPSLPACCCSPAGPWILTAPLQQTLWSLQLRVHLPRPTAKEWLVVQWNLSIRGLTQFFIYNGQLLKAAAGLFFVMTLVTVVLILCKMIKQPPAPPNADQEINSRIYFHHKLFVHNT